MAGPQAAGRESGLAVVEQELPDRAEHPLRCLDQDRVLQVLEDHQLGIREFVDDFLHLLIDALRELFTFFLWAFESPFFDPVLFSFFRSFYKNVIFGA